MGLIRGTVGPGQIQPVSPPSSAMFRLFAKLPLFILNIYILQASENSKKMHLHTPLNFFKTFRESQKIPWCEKIDWSLESRFGPNLRELTPLVIRNSHRYEAKRVQYFSYLQNNPLFWTYIKHLRGLNSDYIWNVVILLQCFLRICSLWKARQISFYLLYYY